MSEQVSELQSQLEMLELRLAISRSDLARVRNQTLKSPCIMPVIVCLIAASTLLIAAAPPPKTTTVVTAPFQVVDADENKILEVSDENGDQPRGFALFDSDEEPLVSAVTKGGESYLEARSADGTVDVRMGMITQTTADGAIPVFTARYSGSDRLSLSVNDDEGVLDMTTDDKRTCAAEAGVNKNNGGYLILCDSQNATRVKFSTSANGAGTVVTYPNGDAGGQIVGLKGSMLCGLGGCGK